MDLFFLNQIFDFSQIFSLIIISVLPYINNLNG